jgi:hypothetical protein
VANYVANVNGTVTLSQDMFDALSGVPIADTDVAGALGQAHHAAVNHGSCALRSFFANLHAALPSPNGRLFLTRGRETAFAKDCLKSRANLKN